MQQRFKPVLALSAVFILMGFLNGCQPHSDPKQELSAIKDVESEHENVTPALQSKSALIKLTQPTVCDESGCIAYDFQSVETNQKWIDDYFLARIKKANPLPFHAAKSGSARTITQQDNQESAKLSQTSIMVRYIGQNDRLATFELANFIYSAGAAHGMYHNEYVNFDLKAKKRIALQDLLVAGSESKILDALFLANSKWLDDHAIKRETLSLSDNFYYGAHGIVFVYPLYELASYAEGMTELVLPYYQVNSLIKAEYLPNLPVYKQS